MPEDTMEATKLENMTEGVERNASKSELPEGKLKMFAKPELQRTDREREGRWMLMDEGQASPELLEEWVCANGFTDNMEEEGV